MSRNVGAVSDEERMVLVRSMIKNAATIVEVFIAAYEDGVKVLTEEALTQLTEARTCLESAYLDTYRGDESEASWSIDVITYKGPVRLSDDTVDDSVI